MGAPARGGVEGEPPRQDSRKGQKSLIKYGGNERIKRPAVWDKMQKSSENSGNEAAGNRHI
jgi:hypothetical protein